MATTAALLRWFEPRRRAYPWRGEADPYRILVSEVMLQQTQAERVRPAYERFVRAFPTVRALAEAPVAQVIRAWGTLGYPRRAVRLHRAAGEILERFGGRVPSAVDELASLPGVGPYTAAAVACFAFGAPGAVMDTNTRRVTARAFLGRDPKDLPARVIDATAADGLSRRRAADWNQALMDLGRTVCVARPRCDRCPLADACAYRRAGRLGGPGANGRAHPPFEGSARQARGRVMALLRARGRVTLGRAARETGFTHRRAAALIAQLERDGLCAMSAAARSGRPGGMIELP